MEIGLQLPALRPDVRPADVIRFAREAEQMGFHSVWTPDHLLTPVSLASRFPYTPDGVYGIRLEHPYIDAVALLAVLAGATERIVLGAAVLVPGYRHPAILAKELAAIDLLSGGRLLVGLGAGWMAEEYESVGLDPARRGARFEEHVAAMRRIWSEGICDFEGEFYAWAEASFLPKPPRPTIPLLFGGHADAVLRRVARMGDGWAISAMLAGGGSREERLRRVPFAYYRDGVDRLRRICDEEGRDFASVVKVVSRPLLLTDVPPADRPLLCGPPGAILGDIESLSALGVEVLNVAVQERGIDDLLRACSRIAEHVLPQAVAMP